MTANRQGGLSWDSVIGEDWESPCPDNLFRTRLLSWFKRHGREYPWRRATNPFHVLTAEVMLQRTRADQVEPVYQKFAAEIQEPADVLKRGPTYVDELFEPLGLRWRAKQYFALCCELAEEYHGRVPETRTELMDLPGIGQYAAGATLTFAHGSPTGVLDSNVLRVYGRYCGIAFTDSDRRRGPVRDWADSLVPDEPAAGRRYNLALVDLAASVCVPRNPRCSRCPLTKNCHYSVEHRSEL